MNSLKRRLLPLFLANLFLGLMFHYSIAFPYMDRLGFSTTQIVSYAVIANLVVLLVEIPSGILADRWSRKGVLMLSLVFMAAGCLLVTASDTYVSFMIAIAVAAVYFGMSSGVQEAMVYDVLLENKSRKDYEKVIGRLRAVFTVGLVISSLAGAVIASESNFRIPYYLSVASCVIAFAVLIFFKEPRLHRQVESSSLPKHIRSLFRLLTQHSETRLLVLTNILIGVVVCFMQEVDPLWPIALGLAVIWYGPLNALLLSSQGLAGLIAGVASIRLWVVRVLGVAMIVAAIGLTIQSMYLVFASQFLLLTCATTLMIILSGRIQDALPSSQRSGSESAISTLARFSFIVSLPVFSFVATEQSVFVAAWIVVLIAVIAIFGPGRKFLFADHGSKLEV